MKSEKSPLRRTLVIYFSIIISLMSLISIYTFYMVWYNYRSTENMFRSVFYTTSLSMELNDTHQKLTNLLNYQDSSLIVEFETGLSNLISDVKKLDSAMLQFAESADDMNAYYDFIKIQEAILIYGEKSRVLVAKFRAGTDRAVMYGMLYELKDLVESTFNMQSALLLRQSIYTQEFYNIFEKTIIRNTYVILILITSIIALALFLAFRFSNAISGPIHQLVVYTGRIGGGEFVEIKRPGHVNREIEQLFISVDNMSGKLEALIGEIEKKADVERLLKEEEIKNLRNENLLQQTEMELLQSQINPHFLFNTLNMINTLTQIEEAEQTGKMIESLSNLLRYILKRDGNNSRLADELEIIDDYMFIQLTRFGSKIKYTRDIDDSLLDTQIPPMSLQPFVENAIIHGLEPKVGDGHLHLSAEKTAQDIVIRVIDNGLGMNSEKLEKLGTENRDSSSKRSMGIVNSLKRLEIYYGKNVTEIKSEEGRGTEVIISLPF